MTVASPPHSPPIATADRERQRFEHLVLGRPRPKAARNKARKGKIAPIVQLAAGIEEIVKQREEWAGFQGTPETRAHAAAAGLRVGTLRRLVMTGAIDVHQHAAAEEIAEAHAMITADVAVRTARFTPRHGENGPNAATVERVGAILRQKAYDRWRTAVGSDGAMLLAIIVDEMPLTAAARRWRRSNRMTRAILVRALDGWRRV